MIKVGDTVFVKNWGDKFPMYTDWFVAQLKDKDFDVRWAIRFAYGVCGDVSPRNMPYVVLYVSGDKALITDASSLVDGKVYLFGINGLRYFRRMTKQDIEKELGYEIEIIGEEE